MLATPTDRFVETLARLNQFVESPIKEKRLRPPISIAVSRQAGARGGEVARMVGARLGWPVYDHELVERIAQEKGLQARMVEQLDERHASWLEEMVTAFCVGGAGREITYLRSLLGLFGTLSDRGHCVIVGRGAGQVLPAESTLRVRVVAPRENRIAAVEKRLSVPRAEAERWIDRTEADRGTFARHFFQKDITDLMGYDLVLNTGKISPALCADLIADAAREMEARGAI